MNSDVRRTLQELEGEDWGEANYDSYVVSNCHRLHRVPLNEYTVEDLRLMIGQEIGLKFAVHHFANHLSPGHEPKLKATSERTSPDEPVAY